MIATSIEQSKKLVELDIDLSTADMFYPYVLPRISEKIEHTPQAISPIKALEYYNKGYTYFGDKKPLSLDEYCVPAWSLSVLLELMPLINEYNIEYRPIIERYKDDGWVCKYYNEETRSTDDVYIRRYGRTPLDAAFEMVAWLKENKYI